MIAPTNPTATRAQADPLVLDGAASVPQRKATVGKLVFTIFAALAVAFILNAAVCLLPENDYQRWQLQDPDGRLRWIYERIHFDPTPIDIAIVGPSREQLGFSPPPSSKISRSTAGALNVVNFAMPAPGATSNGRS